MVLSPTPTQVSPLIKTARWGLLFLGIAYGYQHKKTVAKWRKRERVEEHRIKDNYLKEHAEKKQRERMEFESNSILYQK